MEGRACGSCSEAVPSHRSRMSTPQIDIRRQTNGGEFPPIFKLRDFDWGASREEKKATADTEAGTASTDAGGGDAGTIEDDRRREDEGDRRTLEERERETRVERERETPK